MKAGIEPKLRSGLVKEAYIVQCTLKINHRDEHKWGSSPVASIFGISQLRLLIVNTSGFSSSIILLLEEEAAC